MGGDVLPGCISLSGQWALQDSRGGSGQGLLAGVSGCFSRMPSRSLEERQNFHIGVCGNLQEIQECLTGINGRLFPPRK